VASENGLFKYQTQISYSQVLNPLTKSLALSVCKNLTQRQYELARKYFDISSDFFYQMLHDLRFRTRLKYVYGVHVLAYLLFVLASLGWFSVAVLTHLGNIVFLGIPLQVMVAGAFGGVIQGLYWLWYNVNRSIYRNTWATWFFECPIMGALLRGAVYLAFLVGLVATTLGTTLTNPGLAYVIAIVAGYNWDWAQRVLKKIADAFSSDNTA